MTSRITCDAHDYFEIACMRRSQILVTTYSSKTYQGIAFDIEVIEGEEMLLIKSASTLHHVLLTDIKKLQGVGNKVVQHNFSQQWSQP